MLQIKPAQLEYLLVGVVKIQIHEQPNLCGTCFGSPGYHHGADGVGA
jgi:hypothetical protein